MISLRKMLGQLFVVMSHTFIRPVYFLIFRKKYGNCKIFRPGAGGYNKYIISINDTNMLIKKTDFLINLIIRIAPPHKGGRDMLLSKRYKLLQNLLNTEFSRYTLCIQAMRDRLIYVYEENAQILNENNFSFTKFNDILKAIDILHRQKLFFVDLHPSNIVVLKNGKYKLIDLDAVEPAINNKDYAYDYKFFKKHVESWKQGKRLKILLDQAIIKTQKL